jgi:alcohol dehydrogenase
LKCKAGVLYASESYRPYTQSRPVKIEEVELEPPRAGEALIRVAGAGICHSDIAVISGVRKLPMPLVLGHECSGIVEDIGEGTRTVKKGDHVVISYVPSCGRCMYCASGTPALCDPGRNANRQGSLLSGGTRFRLEGKEIHHHLGISAFSEYTVVSENSAIPVTKDVPIEKLALFGCAVLAGIGSVINSARMKAGSTTAVFGCGGVGLNVIQGANLAGAKQIIAVDVVESKLSMARSLGATEIVNASTSDPIDEIRKLTGGAGVDYSFEAVGNTDVMAQAFRATRKGGETILVGVTSPEDQLTIPSSWLVDDERKIKGSYMGSVVPRRDIPLLADLYDSGRIKLDELVSRYVRLDQVNEALEALADGEVARQIIRGA